jgi:hypothetical protein
VKKVAKGLLEILKAEKLVLDWRSRQQSRAVVRQFIESNWTSCPKPTLPTSTTRNMTWPTGTSTTTTTVQGKACMRQSISLLALL